MIIAGEDEVFGCFETNALVGAWVLPSEPNRSCTGNIMSYQ